MLSPALLPSSAMPDATAWRSSLQSNDGQLGRFIRSVKGNADGLFGTVFNVLGGTCFSYGDQSVMPQRTTSRYLPYPTLQIYHPMDFKL